MSFRDLPTLAEMEAERRGKPLPKGLPQPLAKAEKKKTKAALERAFRLAVWGRDKSRSRATGKPLSHSGTDWTKVGEVHHVIPRSLAPERIYDVTNGVLLSKEEHALAETMCPNAPGFFLPDDLTQPQTFIFRDVHGKELRRRIG